MLHQDDRQQTLFSVGFYFYFLAHFQIFPSRGCPSVSARDMTLMDSSLAQKPLIAPYCLSDKSRALCLAFKAFWDLALIYVFASYPPFLSICIKGECIPILLDFGHNPQTPSSQPSNTCVFLSILQMAKLTLITQITPLYKCQVCFGCSNNYCLSLFSLALHLSAGPGGYLSCPKAWDFQMPHGIW